MNIKGKIKRLFKKGIQSGSQDTVVIKRDSESHLSFSHTMRKKNFPLKLFR